MANILWVEDQSHWVNKFKKTLENSELDGQPNHIQVFKFSEAARQHISKLSADDDRPDIAILDAHMNGFDGAGFSVLQALRKKWPQLPVIFLSEHNGTDIEREALTQYDALDFISKHQRNVDEVLCWRIKAALRHTALQDSSSTTTEAPGDTLISGSLSMDLNTWEVYWKGHKLMNPDNPRRPLAPTPRRILRALVEHSPRPVSTSQIAEALDADPDTYQAATYRQHVKTLRRAFEAIDPGFLDACQQDRGIVTFGEDGAYCWKKDQ